MSLLLPSADQSPFVVIIRPSRSSSRHSANITTASDQGLLLTVEIPHPPSFTPQLPMVHLSTKAIKSTSLSLQRIHNIQARDRLALGMFGIGDRIADDGFQEGFEDAAGFFVDHLRGS